MTGIRHVWVRPEGSPSELAGLVLDWRSDPDGWQALVTYVEASGRAVTGWLPADQLRPVEGARPSIGSQYG